jgi:hypothetical protein
MDLLKNWENY